MPLKHLSSRANPQFKSLRALAGDAGELRRQGLALLDGCHLVSAYVDKFGLPQSLIVSERGLAQGEIAALVARLAVSPGLDCLQLPDALFAQLSALATPTGLLALIRIPDSAPSAAAKTSTLLLDAVQDAGNVGTILRSAAAAGIDEVFLGPGCASAWSPRVLRAGQGAHFHLRIHEQADLAQAMSLCVGPVLAAVAGAGRDLYACDLRGPVAWLFGNEGNGIAADLLAGAAQRVSIPMAAGSESLNVAAAATVCLFEELRQKRQTRV